MKEVKSMNKKFKMLAFIIFFAIIGVLGYVIYSNATKSNEQSLDEKVLTEIKYLEVKIVNIANKINNITTRNYKVTTKSVEQQSDSEESSSTNSSNENKNSDSSKEESTGNKTSEVQGTENVKEISEDKEKEINWEDIQKDIEEIYTVIPTITLDLYQTSINQEDILKFNGYLDELAINTKNNDKEKILESLCYMYSCITKFIENVSKEEEYKSAIKAKENVLVAYSRVTLDKWEKVEQDLQSAIDVFSVLLTNTNINYKKQINVNKTYVILNELKNVASKKDKDVFFIKYKNLLEEIDGM